LVSFIWSGNFLSSNTIFHWIHTVHWKWTIYIPLKKQNTANLLIIVFFFLCSTGE
jgi:hypothetical protein